MPLMYNGEKIKRLMWMGNVIMEAKDEGGTPTSAAEWIANPAALKVAADDIATNGTASSYYAEFAQYMANDADFPVPIENASSYTSVAADQVINYRLVDIAREDASGAMHGLWFQAKRSLPKAYNMDKNAPAGGWLQMELRTTMNSGEIWLMHPSELRSVFSTVSNTSYTHSSYERSSSDKLFIASLAEMNHDQTTTGDGPQFSYWKTNTTAGSEYTSRANMDLTNSGTAPSGRSNAHWWTRSMYSTGTSFIVIAHNGGNSYLSEVGICGVVPCFAIGDAPVTFNFVDGQTYTVDRAEVVAAWDKFHS